MDNLLMVIYKPLALSQSNLGLFQAPFVNLNNLILADLR